MTYVKPGGPEPTGDVVLLLVQLVERLHVEADLLGTRWPISGTPGATELVMPDATPADVPDLVYRPLAAPNVPGADRAFAWWNRRDPTTLWGAEAFASDDGTTTSAHPYFALVMAPHTPPADGYTRRAFAMEIGAAIDAWLSAHLEWLEVIADVDFQPDRLDEYQLGPTFVHNVALSASLDGQRLGFFEYASIRTSVHHEEPMITLRQWEAAVTLANDSAKPEAAHLFLRDARAALRRGNTRRAVVDACTAAEVALAHSVRQLHPLSDDRPDDVNNVIASAGGVVRLFDLHDAIQPIRNVSRGAVMSGLANPRNESAHAGAEIERARARDALETARLIVHSTSPLPIDLRDEAERSRSAMPVGIVSLSMGIGGDSQL